GSELAPARRCEHGLDLVELLAHHLIESRAVGEDFEQLADVLRKPFELSGDFVAAERGQAVQAQFEDRLHLRLGQPVHFAGFLRFDRLDQLDVGADLVAGPLALEQFLTRLSGGGRSTDQLHHLVEIGDRNDQAEQDVSALAGLEQLELRAPRDDFLAEADEALDDVAKRQRFGAAAADRQHVGGEARLRRGAAPQLVQHDLWSGVALQLDDDADAFAVGLVTDVGDTLDALVLGGFGDLLDEAVFADLVRDLGEHDRAALAAALLDVVAGAHHDGAGP